jgi:hypothetical protein
MSDEDRKPEGAAAVATKDTTTATTTSQSGGSAVALPLPPSLEASEDPWKNREEAFDFYKRINDPDRRVAARAFGELQLTKAQYARGVNVTPATVTKWLEENDPLRSIDGLVNLCAVFSALLVETKMDADLIAHWLTTKDPYVSLEEDVLTRVGLGQDLFGIVAAGKRYAALRLPPKT